MPYLRTVSVQLLLLFAVLSASAQPLRVDFRQAANDDRPFPRGDVHWIQSILQTNNSLYYEGMSIPQRILLTNIPPTRGNIHTLVFSHKVLKGGVHAFDYLTSYSQAVDAANVIVGPSVLQNLNECGVGIGPPSTLQPTCNALRAGPYHFSVILPDNMGTLNSHDIAASVVSYEARFGNRTTELHGDAPIQNATMVFNGYSSGRDASAEYTLSWESSASSVLIEFASHLAMGLDLNRAGPGIGYGSGFGSGSITGGSYHVSLEKFDGKAVGSKDNQIMGNAVRENISCAMAGPDPVCANSQNQYSFNSSTRGLTYSWSVESNSSGASIVGASNGSSVIIDAGATPGMHVVSVRVSDGLQTVICQLPVTVNGFTVSATPQPILCAGNKTPVTVTASGGVPPYTGTGTFLDHAGTRTYTVTDSRGCSSSTTITITEPAALLADASASTLQCGTNSASVSVTAKGGNPPYQGIGVFQRGPGTHSFTVTDANNCVSIASVTVTVPPVLAVSATAPDILCHGGTSTVTVSATGGTAPYTGTGTFQRSAGTHTFTVTDANGCSGTATVTITEPASALIASATATPVSCNGARSTVTVTAKGGTPPYTGTGTFRRGAGTYTFTVTDANGCAANTAAITITQSQSAPTVSVNATPILCNGGTSTVTVTASGGTPPYAGTGTFTYGAGTYTFTVTDANGCSGSSAPITLTEPQALLVSVNAPPITCFGGSTNVTVSASGGTPPYTGTGTFQRSAGTYTFTVTDANGCSASSSATTLSEPSQLTVSVNAAAILCHGGTSTVTVSASGGTPPYTGTGTFQRSAGTYTFTVTDANGCAANSGSITITQPQTAMTATATATPILCNGGFSAVTVSASGGTPPYTGTGTFNRRAGTHTFSVTDALGCTVSTAPLTITEPPALAVSVNAPPITCNGGTSTVTVAASGGTPPYTGTGSFLLGPGTYTFTVTDANGCSASSSAMTLTNPPVLSIAVNATPILCHGGTSTITVTASGGAPPYVGTGTFTRGAGTYTFSVTDANGCTATSGSVTITQPAASMTATATATPILCNGGTSTITVTASGGTPPYTGTGTFSRGAGTHTFTVTDALGCSAATNPITLTEPPAIIVAVNAPPIPCNGGMTTVTVTASGGTPPYTGTGSFQRGAGSYVFTVTDANGCSASSAVATLIDPAQLVINVSATPILCHGGTSTVTVSAGGGTPPYAGTGTFTRGPGTYTFSVTDANGCSATSASITITQPLAALTVTASATPILCFGGSSTVTVSAFGGTPPYSGTGTFNRGTGTYTFTVTDANGCAAASAPVTITQPPQLTVSASAPPVACGNDSALVTVTASGGTPPYNGVGTFRRTLGTYTFSVTDANGCTVSAQVTVSGPPPLIVVANATPVLCHGDLSTITVSASGGNPPYSGTGIFQLGAGTHTFTVTDASNCSESVTITVTEPPVLDVIVTAPPIVCNGDSSTVTVIATGGTPPYIGTGTFDRGPGTYTFTVIDANGCRDSASVTLVDPPVLTVTATATPILCYGDTSYVTVTASGGVPPYSGTGVYPMTAGTYTFNVADANGCIGYATVNIFQPPQLVATANAPSVLCGRDSAVIIIGAIGGTQPYSGTGSFTRVAGTYTFVVTDANGCTDTVHATVAGPSPLYATVGATAILCHGGLSEVTVSAYGGTPPYNGVGIFTVPAGTYTFIVYDANNCTDTVMITIVEPPPLQLVCTMSECVNGVRTLSATVTGGTPMYSYYWSPFATTGPTVTVPCSFQGTVTLRVRDAHWTASDPNNAACEEWCTLQIFSKAVGEESKDAAAPPNDYMLYENYPNPFNPATTIRYFMPEQGHVFLSVINTLGQTVATLVDTELPAGMHEATWSAGSDEGTSVPSGSYIYRIQVRSAAGKTEFVQERLMLLLK